MTIDILPTLAGLAGSSVPKDRIIDGRDIWPLLSGSKRTGEFHDALYFYWGNELHAVRSGKWKLHLPHPSKVINTPGSGGQIGPSQPIEVPLSLYDLEADVGETTNVADKHPDVVERLKKVADRAREDLGDSLTKREGKNVRPPGR